MAPAGYAGCCEAIAAGIGGSRLRVLRGAAHLASVCRPGEVTAALAHLAAPAGP